MTKYENKKFTTSIQKLLNWSKNNHHQLPWRKKRSIYGTLVSEIMLQQTTVGTVLNHFEKFMLRFPTIADLAKASHQELAVEWKGLGYYRRAKNLKACAEEVYNNYSGKIPKDRDLLIKIKGIGDYTADALIAIGNNEKALAIDANLERVISRLYAIDEIKGLKLQKKIREKFYNDEIFHLKDFESWRALNEALMDLGRVYCRAKKAFCENCPLEDICAARALKKELTYPLQDAKKGAQVFYDLNLLRVVVRSKDSVYVYQKNQNEWLADQWEVPTFIISTSDETLQQYPKISDSILSDRKVDFEKLKNIKTSITKYKITNYILEVESIDELKKLKFPRKLELHKMNDKSNLSTATFKLLKFLGNKK